MQPCLHTHKVAVESDDNTDDPFQMQCIVYKTTIKRLIFTSFFGIYVWNSAMPSVDTLDGSNTKSSGEAPSQP